MKAVRIMQTGGPEVLENCLLDDPVIQTPTEVRVKLKAAGINPVDTKFRAGAYPIKDYPAVLGCDGAGTVEATGSSVSNVQIGDEVYFFHGGLGCEAGNYAEYKVLDARFVARKPVSFSFVEAAAAPLVFITAWEALFDRARLQAGHTVFINAGAGGVGHVAIQLAKHAGASVCTTISNAKKAAFVQSLGADCIINYREEDVHQAIMQWTRDEGVDVALDNVGGPALPALFTSVKYFGDVVSLLQPDDGIDWTEARFRNHRFSMETMLSPLMFNLKEAQLNQTRILSECARLVDAGNLSVTVSETLPLTEAGEAHRRIEAGLDLGKLVLEID